MLVSLPDRGPSRDGAVYHVTKDGWKKVTGTDVGQLHYEYYKKPEEHPTWGVDPLGPPTQVAAA